jgi:hypothetical protein
MNRNAWLEPADAGEAKLVRSEQALREAPRQEHIWSEVDQSKVPWHHSDHLAWNEIDRHRAAKYLAIAAELPLPISITQDHGLWGAWRVVFAREPSADIRRHAQRGQNTFGRGDGHQLLRISPPGHGGGAGNPDAEGFEGLRALLTSSVHAGG